MNHLILIWFALVCGSVLMGASIVALLIAERVLEPLSAVSMLLGFAAAAWGFGQITTSYDGLNAVGYALFFGAAAVAGGYALASTLLAHLALRPVIPSLPEALPLGDSTPAIVLLSELEPALYSARATAAALDDLAEEGLLDASMWVLPFLFMAQKTRYRAAGGTSPGPRELDAVSQSDWLCLFARAGSPISRPPHAKVHTPSSILVAAAARRGSRTIVVAEAFIAESIEVDRAKRAVDALRLSDRGVTVSYTDPLSGSSLCASLVAAKTFAVAGDTASCGVVLVGQAQPVERSRIADTFDHQESGFLNQIRMLLIERGISEQRVHIAWADWRSPEVTGSVRHLAAQGCRTVVVVPACFPLDSITTMLDLPLSVRQARVDQSVRVLTLRAWHDDPGLVEALRARVLAALEVTDSNAAAALRTTPRSAPSSTNASA